MSDEPTQSPETENPQDLTVTSASSRLRERARISAGTRVSRFEVIREIGSGGMGVVYEAYDSRLDRKIALKLLAGASPGSVARDRLLREAQAMARVAHPNVATVHEVGSFGDQVFVAMELIDGPSLHAWLGQEHEWTERLRMLVEAGEGLAAAHAKGLVHRDFKPANVMVGSDRRPRVLDFGLVRSSAKDDAAGRVREAGDDPELAARRLDGALGDELSTVTGLGAEAPPAPEPSASSASASSAIDSDNPPTELPKHERESGVTTDSTAEATVDASAEAPGAGASLDFLSRDLTHAGAIMGTPAYMAPEQFGGFNVTARSDQFSFCIALYEALYGKRPFSGRTVTELMVSTVGPVRFPERSSIPRALARIIERGLDPDPDKRWPSMAELLIRLREQLQLHDDPQRDLAVGRRQRALLLVGLTVTMIAVVLGMEFFDPAKVLSDPVRALQVMTLPCAFGMSIVFAARKVVGRNRINRQIISLVLVFGLSIWLNRVVAVPLELAWPEVYILDLASLCLVGAFSGAVIHRSLFAMGGLAALGVVVCCFKLAWAPYVGLLVNCGSLLGLVFVWRGGARDQKQAEAAMTTSWSRLRSMPR